MRNNGRIYTHTDGGTKYGVSVCDVSRTLGRGTGDVGQLCSDQEWYDNNGTPTLRLVDKINKWAKYRPIEKANYKGILTDAMRSAENWGIGYIPKWTNKTIPAMVKFWIGGSQSTGSTPPDCGIQPSYWTKVLPSTAYRLRDFAADVDDKGYWHGADAPISQFVGELAIPSTGQLDVNYLRGAESNETILLSDIGSFSTFFFGVIFANADFSKIYLVTQEYAMNSQSWTQDFTIHIQGAASVLVPTGTSATWKVFPILINAQSAVTTLTDVHSSLTNYTLVALLDPVEAVITKNGFDYTLVADSAWRDALVDPEYIHYSYTFTNNDSSGVGGVRLKLEFRTSLNEVVGSVTKQIGSVSAGASYTVSDSIRLYSRAASVAVVVGYIDHIDDIPYTVEYESIQVSSGPPRD